MARKSRKTIYPISRIDDGQLCFDQNLKNNKGAELLPTGAYVRLSVENNGHETDGSLKTQITLVESFVREHGELELTDTYIDNGVSGTKFDRPEFIRMMEDVKNGKIRCVVVKDLSRFGRDYLETGYYLETIFPLLNVRFIAITDNYDSTREEDRNSIAAPIKNMVNDMYAKDYSRKQEAFREICKKTGRVMGNYAAFGYTFNPETKKMEIDQAVAPYVRMVFAWALAGVPRLEIAKRMNLLNAPTPASLDNQDIKNKWQDSTITHMLYNPIYAGFHVMNKSKLSLYKGIGPLRTERKEWLCFPDFHEPYITMEDYESINAMIGEIKQERTERLKVREEIRAQMPDVFQGKVFCADCGRQMNYGRGSHHRGYIDISFQYYRCRYSKKYAKCSNKKVQQNYLKIVVMDQIRVLVKAACDKERLIREIRERYAKPGSRMPIERGISRLKERERITEEKLLKAYEDYADQLLNEEEFIAVKEKLTTEKREIEQKLEAQKSKLEELNRAIEQYEGLTARLERYMEIPEFDEKLVKELVSRIYVSDDGGVEVVFQCEDVFQNALIEEYLRQEDDDEYCDLFEAV